MRNARLYLIFKHSNDGKTLNCKGKQIHYTERAYTVIFNDNVCTVEKGKARLTVKKMTTTRHETQNECKSEK